MVKLHGEVVALGDKVWDILHGWGVVSAIDHREKAELPLKIDYINATFKYAWIDASLKEKRLYWQPIVFEIPKKPAPKEKAWQWVYFDVQNEVYGITFWSYTSVEDFYSSGFHKDRYKVIEPYLTSEKEREMKE